ncbi:general odorant-binding protein 45-like [Culex pipiens pallens]|uniref:general odorant-binding protein 45-like n=1 Tax=Culex pipiens pallens TaxID=42434 RepID=UPI00195390F9|nr:general odorant-binding protein 45-like [Culex pipiens pallens]
MKFLLLALTTLLASARSEDLHSLRYKTVEGAYSECWRLLQLSSRQIWQPCAPCENHCCATLLRLWNDADSSIRTPICPRFFHSKLESSKFLADADCCANRMLEQVPPKEKCRRTDGYYLCFNASGILQHDRKYFLPATELQQQRSVSECADFLQINSDDEWAQIFHRGLVSDPRGRCLIRCVLVRQQLYSEVLGVNERRVFVQSGNLRDEEHFRRGVRQCVQRLERTCSDRCTLAARIAAECLGQKLWSDIERAVKVVGKQRNGC